MLLPILLLLLQLLAVTSANSGGVKTKVQGDTVSKERHETASVISPRRPLDPRLQQTCSDPDSGSDFPPF